MLIRKIMILVLAAVLLAGCIGAASADNEDINTITNVNVEVMTPLAGATISTSNSSTLGTEAVVTWNPYSESTFAANTVYTIDVSINAKEGYKFSTTNINVTINGEIASITSKSDSHISANYPFKKTNPAIELVEITLDNPEVGEIPDTPSSEANVSIITSWTPSILSGGFSPETIYSANFTIDADSANIFGDSVEVKLNDEPIITSDILRVSNSKIYAVYNFTKTDRSTNITSVSLTGIDAPETGKIPDTGISVITPTPGNSIGTPIVTWTGSPSTFAVDTNYTVNIQIPTASAAYIFDANVTVKINGNNATVSYGKDSITASYTYPKTQTKGTISSLSFEIIAPVVGAAPNTTITSKSPSDRIESATLSWSSSPTKYAADTTYTATIVVELDDEYTLAATSSLTAKVNGLGASVARNSNTKATITYKFSTSTSVNSVAVTLSAPKTGSTGDSTAIATSNPAGAATTASVSWTPSLTSGRFIEGKQYQATLTIPITTGSSYVFDKDTTVTVNGNKATISSCTTTKIIATYIFPATATSTPTPTSTLTIKTTATATTPAPSGNFSINLNGTDIPSPLDMIKEFVKLFFSMLEPGNYIIFGNNTTTAAAK